MTANDVVDAGPQFSFETSFNSGDAYPSIRRPARSRRGLTDDQLFVGFAVFGAACLLWRYTIALGAVVLAMATFMWVMRERSRKWREGYRRLLEPPGIIRVGANEAGYWIRGDGFSAENRWDRVINYLEADGFLIVQSSWMPRVQFPIAELQRASVHDRVRGILDTRSARYREAIRQLAQDSSS